MKLTAFFCMVLAMHLSASSFSQNIQFKREMTNVKVSELIKIMKDQTGLYFFYNEDVNVDKKVSVSKKFGTLKEILNEIAPQMNCSYKILENYIILSKSKIKSQQGKKITGIVKDTKGTPLIGVTVMIKGSSQGVATDLDGKYELLVPDTKDVILVFSFIGMEPQEVKYSGQKTLDITLKEKASDLEEVVVTGFFNKGKQGYAGTVSTFKQEDLKRVSTGNVLSTLSVLDAGFRIHEDNTQGSNPNAVPDFTIRGKGSFQNGSTQPVFMVDGFQVSAQYVMDMDQNRIKSITILKDAAATILYGSRAGNGVVVIETVAPRAGELRVTYDFRPTISLPDLSDYDIMNASQKLEYEKLAGLYIGYNDEDQAKKDLEYNAKYKAIQEGVDTYWLSQPVETTLSQAHSLYVEGGVEKMRYGISGSFNDTKGVMKESGNKRYDLGFKLIYRIANKVTLKNNFSYSYRDRYNSPYGSFSTYAGLNPYERIRDEKGDLIPVLSNEQANPLYDAALPNTNQTITQQFKEQLSVDWTINEAFRLKGQFDITKSDIASKKYQSPFLSNFTKEDIPVEKRGFMDMGDGKSLDMSGNITLQYNKTINNHVLFFGAGSEVLYNESEMHGFKAQGFPNDKYQDVAFAMQYVEDSKPYSSSELSKSVGFFLNGNYIYDNRYFVDLSIRYDGSSKFGSNKRFAPFWSVGAGWNIHNEKAWNTDIFNELKIKYNYGVTGNQEFSAYQAFAMYEFRTDLIYNNTIPAISKGYGNPLLKWQNQYSHNLGLDFALWNNRLRVASSFYKRNTVGMLTDITVSPSVGLPGGTYTANLGEIQNTGIELNMNAILIRDRENDFEWGLGLQAAHNKSKLLEISEELKTVNDENNANKTVPGRVYEEGESLTALKAVKSLGIDPTTGEELFLKKDGKTVTSIWDADDKILCGDTEPVVFGQLNSNLFWKGWNLNMVFNYSFGADTYNQTLVDRVENVDPKYNADVRVLNDRWKEPGDVALYKSISNQNTTYISTRFVQAENIFQLKNLSLSYQFEREDLKKYKIQTLRLSFYANDLFRLSNVKIERGTNYPFARSYVFGVNVGF